MFRHYFVCARIQLTYEAVVCCSRYIYKYFVAVVEEGQFKC
jgi:hypothetical protein